MQALPESQLVLLAPVGSARDRVLHTFKDQGIAPRRITFVGTQPTLEYFRQYREIDIAFDPFPYGGGTTTCDALWMGVPVVTLAGQTAAGRGGASILSNVGLPELVAQNEDDYVGLVVKLSQDLPRLKELRATLRGRMHQSPLMNGPRFARHMEAAYREMWKKWCARDLSAR